MYVCVYMQDILLLNNMELANLFKVKKKEFT